jgi:asparagine synthetase B (glutamine-hydrolysing)
VLEAMSASGSALALSRFELAAGTGLGAERDVSEQLPESPSSERDALTAAILPALQRAPCAISFSGGLDSSLVLALAVRVARAHGLPDPVPVSLRFPSVASTEESSWQQLMVAHLGLAEWERIVIEDELDLLGDIASGALSRHGLLWPANAHFHDPVFARANRGSVLTGLDGDGLFGAWRWQRARAALADPRGRTPRDALRILLALSPPSVRAAPLLWRRPFRASWLRPHARLRLRARAAREAATEPSRWDERVAWYARRRYLQLGVYSLGLLASDHDVQVVHPLLDRFFLAALAARGGATGFGDRRQAMRALFGDLLPPELLTRRTKGEFGRALWGPRSRAFAAHWDGQGLDLGLIDPDELRRVWGTPNPPLSAATLLQAAWLARSAVVPR